MPRLVEITAAPETIARARQGESAARAELYAALAPASFALIRRLIGDRTLAEDLFQDTMLAFFERLGSYRAEAPLGAWLRQIAISRCLMYLRSPWHRARLGLAGLEDDLPALTSGPDPESLDMERALSCLSPIARSVIWLYEVEGYSHEEIAQAFGRSVSFSKSQVARAHLRLRAWFGVNPVKVSCNPIC